MHRTALAPRLDRLTGSHQHCGAQKPAAVCCSTSGACSTSRPASSEHQARNVVGCHRPLSRPSIIPRPPVLLSQQQARSRRAPAPPPQAAAATPNDAPLEGNPAQGLLARLRESLTSPYDAEIWVVAIPALCAMLLDPIMGAINSALIGQLGTQQLGAVSVGSLAVSFCTFLFSFLLFLTTPEIAQAVAKKDDDKVSKIAAKGMWIAMGFGVVTTVAVILGAEGIVAIMRPPEAAVAEYATQFIKIRALGIVASLLGFVASGTYRGFKDTRTPLNVAMLTALTSLCLNLLFIYGFGWGVYGSGFATMLAQYVSCSSLCVLLVRKGILRLKDLATPPPWVDVWPLLRAGSVLALRNIISFGMVIYASLLCVRAGSTYQASFEVVRQIWILTIQLFECLNVATQALCAAYLGTGDVPNARSIMERLILLGALVGAGAGALVYVVRGPLVGFFTSDITVVREVMLTLPMVCLLFPLDAIASIMDGSLLAARQTDYLSWVQIGGAAVQYVGLIYLAQNSMISALSIWACLKLLTFFRMGGGYYRNFFSKRSAYNVPPPQPPPAEVVLLKGA